MNYKALKKISGNLTLLFVEDNKDLRESALNIFSKLFQTVDSAVDGKEGLKLYENFYFENSTYYDLIISDIQMPNLDGIEMSRRIFEINKEQKIVIISAYSDKKYLIDLINLGVDGFMQKPLSSEQIINVLYEVCSSFKDKNFLELGEGYSYNSVIKSLFFNGDKVNLSDKELKTLDFLIKNKNQSFSSEDIFNHIYYDQVEKEFSIDSIKSLFKRLRKKLPHGLIINNHQSGYSVNLK